MTSETIIIGVDHGYAAMKTAHISFLSGLVAYEHEPYTHKNVLESDGRYYVVIPRAEPGAENQQRTVTDSGRIVVQPDQWIGLAARSEIER